jgi:hypothetical protein
MGLHHSAQGCEARATLGIAAEHFPQPQRGCGTTSRAGRNLVEVEKTLRRFPKVARASQPWAGGRCPVGANESRTLAALRDTLLPKLLSGELRVSAVVKTMADKKAAEKLVEAKT